jgi:sugar phosphate isomerase/epimerase
MIAAQVRRGNLLFSLQTNIGSGLCPTDLAPIFKTDAERLQRFFDYLAGNQLIDTAAWVDKKVVYCPKLAELSDQHIERLMRENGADKVRTKTPHRKKREERRKKSTSPSEIAVEMMLVVQGEWNRFAKELKLQPIIKISPKRETNVRQRLAGGVYWSNSSPVRFTEVV